MSKKIQRSIAIGHFTRRKRLVHENQTHLSAKQNISSRCANLEEDDKFLCLHKTKHPPCHIETCISRIFSYEFSLILGHTFESPYVTHNHHSSLVVFFGYIPKTLFMSLWSFTLSFSIIVTFI